MTYSRPWMFAGLTFMILGVLMLLHQDRQPKALAETPASQTPADPPEEPKWQSLFDGKNLDGWEAPNFGGQGTVEVKDGQVIIGQGSLMTGIARTGEVLRDNYELAFEAMRLDGCDFFCTTTFPVGKEYCSLVVGGWGGGLVGLSSIDGADASENATSKFVSFKDNQWYRIRIRVSKAAIEAWIDDDKVVDQTREHHSFGIRIECTLCRPLGISTWCTAGAVRAIRERPLSDDEVTAIEEDHLYQD